LSARGLSLRRGREWLFRGLDLSVAPGQLLWLRGPNGCGKTSLLRALVGLTLPDEGAVDLPACAPVYIGHSPALKDDLRAVEALQFLACLHGRDSRAASVAAALQRLQVQHRGQRSVRTLSQGQRRRVALARLALEDTPALWVLDEPFDALDQAGIAVVLQLIREQLQRQGAVVLTSHLPFELPGIAVQTLDLDTRPAHV
jgi:heme exporter protein A